MKYLVLLILFAVQASSKDTKEVQMELKTRVLETQKTEVLDVLLVLDDSNSIADEDFNKMKLASLSLIDSYSSSNDLKIGVIKFSTSVQIIYPSSRIEDVKSSVTGFVRERGDTATLEALSNAESLFQYYGRENSRRVLFLVTDGKPTSGNPSKVASYLKFALNVLIFGIGVGDVDRTVLQELASPNHYFEMSNFQELLTAVAHITSPGTSSGREVVFQPFLQQTPLSFDQDIPLRIKISNIGSSSIPANCVLYFTSPTNYLVKNSIRIEESIGPHSFINVNAKIPVSGSASAKTLPEYIDIEMTDPHGKRITSQDSRIMMSSEYVIKSFEDLKAVLNILIFGCIGSGKTSWVNALLTALSPQMQNKGIVGDAGGHGTENLVKFSLWEGIEGIPKIKINFWDTWGVTPENYKNSTVFPALLDGELPEGYHMQQKTPLNELKNLTGTPQAFDGVLLFLPWDIMQQKQLSQEMHECFKIANKKGFNPLIIVTHIDKVEDEELRMRIKSDIAQMFKISENRVHLVQNYVREDVKNFQIDKKNLIILEEIVKISSGKASSRIPENKYFPYLVALLCVVITFIAVSFVVARGKVADPPAKKAASSKKEINLVKKRPIQRKNIEKQAKAEEQSKEEDPEQETPKESVADKTEIDGEMTEQEKKEETEQNTTEVEVEAELATSEEENQDTDENFRVVQVKIVSGASRQFRIGKNTTIRSLLLQAMKVFAGNDEKAEDYYLADQKGATYVEGDKAWGGSVFYMNKHTSA